LETSTPVAFFYDVNSMLLVNNNSKIDFSINLKERTIKLYINGILKKEKKDYNTVPSSLSIDLNIG
jgi:hypothetical protein